MRSNEIIVKGCLTPVHLLYLTPLPGKPGIGRLVNYFSPAGPRPGSCQEEPSWPRQPPAPCPVFGLSLVCSITSTCCWVPDPGRDHLGWGALGSPPRHREGQGSRPHLGRWPGCVPETNARTAGAGRGGRATAAVQVSAGSGSSEAPRKGLASPADSRQAIIPVPAPEGECSLVLGPR